MEGEQQRGFAVVGTLVDSLPDWSLRVQSGGILVVGDAGTIVAREDYSPEGLRSAVER